MKRAILPCNGLDKPEGPLAGEIAMRCAAAIGGEIVCPVLLNRAPERYKRILAESALIVVDGCPTRCAAKLAAQLDAKIDRKVLVTDALKAAGIVLGPDLRPSANGLAIVRKIMDELLSDLNAAALPPAQVPVFEAPTEYVVVTHDKFEFPVPAADYFFNENDSWARVLDGVARVGISDFMQQKLTDIIFFEPAKIGTPVEQFGELGNVESAKGVFDIISPVSGTVIAANPQVVQDPALINEDPYGKGWLVEVRLADWMQDREMLLDGKGYSEVVKRKAVEDERK